MARRAATVLLALFACAYVAEAQYINGGFGCKYFSIREIARSMQENTPGVTPADINAAINSAKNVNNYLCLSCNTVRMQAQNVGLVAPNYRECWCKAGYGWSQKVTTNSKTGVKSYRNYYGCTKCPDGTTTNPTSGPYRPGSLQSGALNRWTNTVCA